MTPEDSKFLDDIQSALSLSSFVNHNTILRLVYIDNFFELYWIDPAQVQGAKLLATHFAGDWITENTKLFSVVNMFLTTEKEWIAEGIEKLRQHRLSSAVK